MRCLLNLLAQLERWGVVGCSSAMFGSFLFLAMFVNVRFSGNIVGCALEVTKAQAILSSAILTW